MVRRLKEDPVHGCKHPTNIRNSSNIYIGLIAVALMQLALLKL
jgi:hypothetical protein